MEHEDEIKLFQAAIARLAEDRHMLRMALREITEIRTAKEAHMIAAKTLARLTRPENERG